MSQYVYIGGGASSGYAFVTYWEAVSSASGTITIPSGGTLKENSFQDLEEGVCSTITSGLPDFNAAVGLTASAVSSAVWSEVIEAGYSSSELLKLLAAVSFGKTNIVDNGGGSATVTFRDIADTKDRIDADMIGSERSTVTLDAS